jgi:glycosyltransferase involved in cell wall biosynthesis
MEEITELYGAVALLHNTGVPARIIKCGRYLADIPREVFEKKGLSECLVDLTDKISIADMPEIMRAADILVQPGKDGPFNHYRFPCKLPMFLASGRPVVLAASNLGHHLSHGVNCLLLREGTAREIFEYLLFLTQQPEKAKQIGRAGRAFAREHFSWDVSARGLAGFYQTVLDAWHGRGMTTT